MNPARVTAAGPHPAQKIRRRALVIDDDAAAEPWHAS